MFIVGLITYRHRATVTGIYQAVRPKVGYNSLVKFLSRGKWDADAVAQHLIKLLHHRFDNWVYVYDETQAIKTGNKQFGLHFFRNHRYRKRNKSIKVSLGSSVWGVGIVVYHRYRDAISRLGETDMSQEMERF